MLLIGFSDKPMKWLKKLMDFQPHFRLNIEYGGIAKMGIPIEWGSKGAQQIGVSVTTPMQSSG